MPWTCPGVNPHSLVKRSVKESVVLNNLSLHLRACCGLILSTYETMLSVLLQSVICGSILGSMAAEVAEFPCRCNRKHMLLFWVLLTCVS